MVAWHTVCTLKQLGGLGVKNLRLLNHALRARWRWLQWVYTNKPWHGLDFKLSPEAKAICVAATHCDLGNVGSMWFWKDSWLQGH